MLHCYQESKTSLQANELSPSYFIEAIRAASIAMNSNINKSMKAQLMNLVTRHFNNGVKSHQSLKSTLHRLSIECKNSSSGYVDYVGCQASSISKYLF
jgi:DNA replication protein DnaD